MTQDPNLPDGCTQADVDRAMGAMPPELEEAIDEAGAQHDEAMKILAELKSAAQPVAEAVRALGRKYDDAARRLSEIRAEAGWDMRTAIEAVLDAIEDQPFDDIDVLAGINSAIAGMPSCDDLSCDIRETWETDHGR